MARLLLDRGYQDVRPLLGGLEAWQSLGYPVESIDRVELPMALAAELKPAS